MSLDFIKDRRNMVHNLINLDGQGLEISPNWAPLITKQESHVFYCDRISYQDLLEREQNNEGRKHFNCEVLPLDFVWHYNISLKDCVPNSLQFDYIVSSHVLEHVPNFLEYLYQMRSVLKDNGTIVMVLPNVEYTGEHFRPLTTATQLIDAYLLGHNKPSPGQVYEGSIHSLIDIPANETFINKQLSDFKCGYTKEQALLFAEEATKQYIDVHCWSFTANSFLTTMKELQSINLFDFDITDIFEASTKLEFYVKLKPNKPTRVSRNCIINSELNELKHKLDGANSELNELKHKLDGANSELNNLKQNFENTNSELNDLKQKLDNIKKSRSWRFINSPILNIAKIPLRFLLP